MLLVPVLCREAALGCEVAARLARAGIAARSLEIRPGIKIPEAPVYVVADAEDLAVSRAWSIRVTGAHLSRTVALARGAGADLASKLAQVGVRQVCIDVAELPAAIGRIAPAVEATGREQVLLAKRSAAAVLDATRAAFRRLAGDARGDEDLQAMASRAYGEQDRPSSLFLMLDTFADEAEPTVRHCSTVAAVAAAFARELGSTPQDQQRAFLAGLLHDVGKAGVPRAIIEKPTQLTDDETRLMRTHVTAGYDALRRHPETAGVIAEVALLHHEYLDGSGYPRGLKGAEISELTRVVTISDIFSALIERRSYKEPIPAEEAYGMICAMAGKLDPDLVAAFRPVAMSLTGQA